MKQRDLPQEEYDKIALEELRCKAEMDEKLYGHPVHYIQCQCSSAHTFGNVTAFIQNWLLRLFPPNTFKTVHVNSKIAHNQMRSTPNEYLKKTAPMFILRPRIDWTDNTKFLNGTLVANRLGDLYSTYGGTNLQPFFQDNKNEVAIKYQLNRQVMTFDVILIFNTLMQQLNWSNYIMNAVRYEVPFNLETCLESYLSPELLHMLSHCVGIPMQDENGNIGDFMRYINSHSIYPITYHLQGSTQTEEFYRYYPVNIDTLITNFSTDEGEKVGHVMDRYTISFSIRCEFNATGFYYLFSDKLDHKKLSTIIVNQDDQDSKIIPIFTDVITKDDVNLPLGWDLFAQPSCRLQTPNDTVSLSGILNSSIKECIKYHKTHGIPFSEFFRMRVRKQGRLLRPGIDYQFDMDSYDLHFINCDTYFTYKIIIMINVEYINNLVKQVYHLQ